MDWLGTLIAIAFLLFGLQPLIQGRLLATMRAQQISRIERERGSRVITMIHRQETRSLLGMPVSRMIDLEDAQRIIPAIEETPADTPIDLVLHTPGGMVLAAMQIARAIKAHPAKVTVHVPVFAMSGGTLIALAADEIVMGAFSVMGPIDPQIAGIPAASIVAAKREKPVQEVSDLTLVFADIAEKALRQVKAGAVELLLEHIDRPRAEDMAERLAGGYWTHDYALTAQEAKELGLPVKLGVPQSVMDLLKFYPQPVRQSPSIDFNPIQPGRFRQGVGSGPTAPVV